MNISKISSKIYFDDFLSTLSSYSKYLISSQDKNVSAKLLVKRILGQFDQHTECNEINLTHKLFVYFLTSVYKRNKTYKQLLYNDFLFSYLYDDKLIDESILEKFYPLLSKITPELNNYFLNVFTEDDKYFLFLSKSDFLQDIYKYNENLINIDKTFVLEYISYIPITQVHLNILIDIYPELIQIKNNKHIDFVNKFYHNIFLYNCKSLTKEFINKFYSFFTSEILSKDILQQLIYKPVFFELSPIMQQKIRILAAK